MQLSNQKNSFVYLVEYLFHRNGIFIENDNTNLSFFQRAKSVMNKAASELKNEMKETYNKTKAKIETTIETTKENLITEVHERCTGGEPIPCDKDGKVYIYIYIYICLLHTYISSI